MENQVLFPNDMGKCKTLYLPVYVYTNHVYESRNLELCTLLALNV